MKKILAASAIFFAMIFFTGCGDEKVAEEKIPFVRTQKVGQTNINSENIYSGTVCGRYETKMSFQVGGKIIGRNVEVGNQVQAGDLLMTIDAKDILQQSNQGDAQVSSALAQLKLAESNLNRYKKLYEDEAISAATLEQYQTSFDAAKATYQNAKATAEQGHNALSYTNLFANANGVISEINVEEGQVVSAGQTVLTLIQTDELETEINVPENHLSEVTEGKIATVKFWALPDEVPGVVREISPAANPNSRTYRVKISLPNVPKEIKLGMTASVTLTDEKKNIPNVARLPLSAIYQTGNKTQVWIVEDDKVKLKNISVNQFGDNEVLVSGLNPGEIVVTAGVHKLREGQEVRAEENSK